MPPKRKVEDMAEEMAKEAIEDYKAKRKTADDAEAVRKSMLAIAVLGGSLVEIFIGTGASRTTIKIPKDLLAIHSEYFYNRFMGQEDEDLKIDLPSVDSSIFGMFQSWLHCGQVVSFAKISHETWFKCWSMGKTLLAPGFQNHIMDNIRRKCKTNPAALVKVPIVESAFKVTKRGSLLRKFMADIIDCEKPVQRCGEGTPERQQWTDLITKQKDLDVAFEVFHAGIGWKNTHPWNDIHRSRYMEAETSLEEAMLRQVEGRGRSEAEIEAAAHSSCYRSLLEYQLIKKLEQKDVRVVPSPAQQEAQVPPAPSD